MSCQKMYVPNWLHFLTRRLENVKNENYLHVITYNLKRVLSIFRVPELVEQLNRIKQQSTDLIDCISNQISIISTFFYLKMVWNQFRLVVFTQSDVPKWHNLFLRILICFLKYLDKPPKLWYHNHVKLNLTYCTVLRHIFLLQIHGTI